MPATTVSAAAHDVRLSLRPDQARTRSTATMSSPVISICTTARGPLRNATACVAKPPNWVASPSSHSGLRASCTSSRGLPATSSGAAAAWRCSTAAPTPYKTAATSAVTIITNMTTTLKAVRIPDHGADPPIPPGDSPRAPGDNPTARMPLGCG